MNKNTTIIFSLKHGWHFIIAGNSGKEKKSYPIN